MLVSFRRTIGRTVSAFTWRTSKDEVISFSTAISDAKFVLVILPLDGREILAAMDIINLIKKSYKEENITVVADEQGLETARLLPRSRFIQIGEKDVTAFFIPRQEFLQRVTDHPYDMVIDLNLDLVLPSAYIAKATKSRLRIGFNRNHADIYYNFQIQPDPTLDRKLIYDRMAKCLQMF